MVSGSEQHRALWSGREADPREDGGPGRETHSDPGGFRTEARQRVVGGHGAARGFLDGPQAPSSSPGMARPWDGAGQGGRGDGSG